MKINRSYPTRRSNSWRYETARPEKPERPSYRRTKVKVEALKEKHKELHTARKELHEQLKEASKEEKQELITEFKEINKAKHEEINSIQGN